MPYFKTLPALSCFQEIKVSVIGHSNCPRDFIKPGYRFTYFVRGGLTIRQFQSEFLPTLLNTPTDKLIIFILDNELRHDLPRYIYSKFKSFYFYLRNRVCLDITVVDLLPRIQSPTNRVTHLEISHQRALKRNINNFVRYFSIPFIRLRYGKYSPHLKPDGVHLTQVGRQLLKQEILDRI